MPFQVAVYPVDQHSITYKENKRTLNFSFCMRMKIKIMGKKVLFNSSLLYGASSCCAVASKVSCILGLSSHSWSWMRLTWITVLPFIWKLKLIHLYEYIPCGCECTERPSESVGDRWWCQGSRLLPGMSYGHEEDGSGKQHLPNLKINTHISFLLKWSVRSV